MAVVLLGSSPFVTGQVGWGAGFPNSPQSSFQLTIALILFLKQGLALAWAREEVHRVPMVSCCWWPSFPHLAQSWICQEPNCRVGTKNLQLPQPTHPRSVSLLPFFLQAPAQSCIHLKFSFKEKWDKHSSRCKWLITDSYAITSLSSICILDKTLRKESDG